MRLTGPERLILVMLAEIHDRLEIENGVDTKLLTSAIYSGNTWALSWEMPGIVQNDADPTPPCVTEVVDILDMWSFIERAFNSFGPEDQKQIVSDATPNGIEVKFRGFDGNYETEHLGIARFLVEDLDRFSQFKGRELNSHCPSVQGYRRMLDAFEKMRDSLVGHELNVNQVIELLKLMYC